MIHLNFETGAKQQKSGKRRDRQPIGSCYRFRPRPCPRRCSPVHRLDPHRRPTLRQRRRSAPPRRFRTKDRPLQRRPIGRRLLRIRRRPPPLHSAPCRVCSRGFRKLRQRPQQQPRLSSLTPAIHCPLPFVEQTDANFR